MNEHHATCPHRTSQRVPSAAESAVPHPCVRMPTMLARSKRRLLDDEFSPPRPHESPFEMEDPNSFAFAFAYDRSTARRSERPGKRSRAATHPPPPVPPSTPQPIRRTRLQRAKRELARYVARRRRAFRERYRLAQSTAPQYSPCATHVQHRAADPFTATHHDPCKRHGVNCTRTSPPPEKAQGGFMRLISALREKTGEPSNKFKKRRPISEQVTSTRQLDDAAAFAQARRPRSSEIHRNRSSSPFNRVNNFDSDKSLVARWRRLIALKLLGSRELTEHRQEDIHPRGTPPCQCPEARAFRKHVRAHHQAHLDHLSAQLASIASYASVSRYPSHIHVSSPPVLSTMRWNDDQQDPANAYTDISREAGRFRGEYQPPPRGSRSVATAGTRGPQPTVHALVEIGPADDDCDSGWTDMDDEDANRSHFEAVAQAVERGEAPLTSPDGVLSAIATSASLGRTGSLAGIARGETPAHNLLAGPELATPCTSIRALAGSIGGNISDAGSLSESDAISTAESLESDPALVQEPQPVSAATQVEILAMLGEPSGPSVVREDQDRTGASQRSSRWLGSTNADEVPQLPFIESAPALTRSSSNTTHATFASWDMDNPDFVYHSLRAPEADPDPPQEEERLVEAERREAPAPAEGPPAPAVVDIPAPARPGRLHEAAEASLRRVNEIFAQHGPQRLT